MAKKIKDRVGASGVIVELILVCRKQSGRKVALVNIFTRNVTLVNIFNY